MSTLTYWDAHTQRYASVTAQSRHKTAVPSELPDAHQALGAGSTPDALPLAV